MAKRVVTLHHGAQTPRLFTSSGGKLHELPKEFDEFIQAISVARTIAGGSTLEVTARDPHHLIAKQGKYMKRRKPDTHAEGLERAELYYPDILGAGGLWFRAVSAEKVTSDEFKYTFEDREIVKAREYFGPAFSMAAGHLANPRAVFLKKLISRAVPHAAFECPELNVHQGLIVDVKGKKKKTRQLKAKKSTSIEGSPLDSEQRANAVTIIEACDELHASPLCCVAILCAGIQESKLHHKERTGNHIGVFQANVGHYNPADVATEAKAWLKGGTDFQAGGGLAYTRAHPTATPGTVAEAVEASGTQEIPNYEKHKSDAEAILNALGGVHPGTAGHSGSHERAQQTNPAQRTFNFPQSQTKEGGEGESAWDCAEKYATELHWRFYCSAGRFFFVSDLDLERQGAAMEIDEGSEGVTDIKWSVDYNKKKNAPRLEIAARAHLWTAGPGETIIIGQLQGQEVHEGRWIVSDIKRPDITDNAVTITCERPQAPLLEHFAVQEPERNALGPVKLPGLGNLPSGAAPTPEGGEAAAATGSGAFNVLFNMVQTANWIEEKHFPYVFGGGHAPHGGFKPTGGGYDCSSAVSAIIGKGGENSQAMLWEPLTAGLNAGPGDFEGWGQPGTGHYFTVWVHPAGFTHYPEGHVFIEFYMNNVKKLGIQLSPVQGGGNRTFAYRGRGIHNGWAFPNQGNDTHTDDSGASAWKSRHWPHL